MLRARGCPSRVSASSTSSCRAPFEEDDRLVPVEAREDDVADPSAVAKRWHHKGVVAGGEGDAFPMEIGGRPAGDAKEVRRELASRPRGQIPGR
jgi:hypothetical protein